MTPDPPRPPGSAGLPASLAGFLEVSGSPVNAHLRAWQDQGKPVVGFFCTTIPEELLHAAGAFPYRVHANFTEDTTLADAILSRFNCSYVRCVLNLALEGSFDFLDGVVVSNSCDHVRRLYDIWKRKVPRANDLFLDFLSIPHLVSDHGFAFMLEEYRALKKHLEAHFKTSITNEDLRTSIELYNRNRNLLARLHALRSANPSRLTGQEFLRVMLANASIPREVANESLQRAHEFYSAREAPPGVPSDPTRLMLVGSYVDKPAFLRVFEDVGGVVVTDSLCTSVRAFQDKIPTSSKPPLENLARHYYAKLPCPRMMDRHGDRLQFLLDQVSAAEVDGIVLQRMEFCDLHGGDNMLLQHELQDRDIPVLNIDREYLLGDVARFKTRVEAFIEQIRVMA